MPRAPGIVLNSPEHIASRWIDPAAFRDFAGGKRPGVAEGVSAVVLAVDPGGTTGYAGIRLDLATVLRGRAPISRAIQEWTCGQIDGDENEQILYLKNYILKVTSCAVVIEDFSLRKFNRDRELLAPVRVTAALEWAIWQTDRVTKQNIHIIKQMPALAMTCATDDRLKRTGLYRKGEEHARDAVRHAVTYLRRLTEPGPGLRSRLDRFAANTGFGLPDYAGQRATKRAR